MDPFGWLVIGFLGLLAAVACGVAALAVRPIRNLQTSGRLLSLYSVGLSAIVLPIYLWAAPGTNIPNQAYKLEAVLSAPGLIAVTLYPWSQKKQKRGVDMMQPPKGGSGAV